jgi:hypothetical protein
MGNPPILFEGHLRWAERTPDGWLIHCVPYEPALYPSEAAAFADITSTRAGIPADWSKDL